MPSKPKILVINSKRPYPIFDGAAIRSMQMLRILASAYTVDLVFTYDQEPDRVCENELAALCNAVYAFKVPRWRKAVNALFGLINRKPLQCSYFYSRQAQRFIDRRIDSYAVVFCNNIRTAPYILDKNCTKVMDYVDAFSMNYTNGYKSAGWLWKLIYRFEINRCINYERQILEKFDSCLIISPVDRDFILSSYSGDKNIAVVGNGVKVPDEIVMQGDEKNIVFVGTMDYQPNISAVSRFATAIFPQILQSEPSTTFYVVGSRPTAKVRALSNSHIHVTGFVEDPKDYLRKAAVVVVPMFSGSGVQNKILEAMSMGCVVVTTLLGAEGLPNIEPGQNIFIENNDREFAVRVVELLRNRDLREKIGRAAQQYIRENLSIQKIRTDFLKSIENL